MTISLDEINQSTITRNNKKKIREKVPNIYVYEL